MNKMSNGEEMMREIMLMRRLTRKSINNLIDWWPRKDRKLTPGTIGIERTGRDLKRNYRGDITHRMIACSPIKPTNNVLDSSII
jgi:hypothetical protein